MARKRRRVRRRKNNTFAFTSSLPKGRKAKKKALKAQNAQAEKLNNVAEGFENAETNPFDEKQNIIDDIKEKYNGLSGDEKRFNTFIKKGYADSLYQYNKLMGIYQSDVYVKLKELGYSDSHQIMDLIQSFDDDISAEDLENALLSLTDELKLQQMYNTQQIREAMDLGFTFDEAVYLTENDRVDEIKPEESLLAIRDRLSALLETRAIRKQLADELRNERW